MSQLLTLSFPSSRPFEVLKNIFKIKIKKFLILFLTPLKHMKAIDIAIKINEIKNKIILNHQGSLNGGFFFLPVVGSIELTGDASTSVVGLYLSDDLEMRFLARRNI